MKIMKSTIVKILFLPSMKRLLSISLICLWASGMALSGTKQIHVEELYDTYRARYLAPLSTEKQIEILSKTQSALAQYSQRSTLSQPVRDVVAYLEHLFCHTQSLLTGYYCQDNYQPESILTMDKNKLSLTQIRSLLIAEHSKRRIERGFSALTESEILDTIAQEYATQLCGADEITHTLNGSTLEERFAHGGYDYVWGGENLGLGQENIMELLDQLTTSIHHRENMYQAEFREIGVGQCNSIWVLNYGSR